MRSVGSLPLAVPASTNTRLRMSPAPGEPLDILEAVVAAEAADGLAFFLDKCQPRMLSDGLAELLQLAVDCFLAQGRVEGGRVKEDVDVFRKPLDQAPALRQAGAALEDHLAARRLLDDAQRLGDVVVLLDDRLAQAPRAEMFRRADDGLLEVRMFKQLHGPCAPSPAIASRMSSRRESRNQTGRGGSNSSAMPTSRLSGWPSCCADGPEHGADARRFRRGDLEQALEATRFAEVSEQLVHRFLGGQLTRLPRLRRKSRRAASVSESVRHDCRPAGVDRPFPCRRSAAAGSGRWSPLRSGPGFCVVKPSRLAAAMPAGKTPFRRMGRDRIWAVLGRLGPNAVGREPVVQALAQPLDHALAGQAGQRLGDCHERHAVEVGQPPDPLAAGFDPLANGFGGVSRA